MGADEVCKTAIDQKCFGDYYQWGRAADGHESYNSGVTNTLANRIDIGHNNFITIDDLYYKRDWLTRDGGLLGLGSEPDNDGKKRSAIWSKTDGTSVCPVGFRVPNGMELTNEFTYVRNSEDAFNNFLKLPKIGYRWSADGSLSLKFEEGSIWSTSFNSDNSMSYYFVYANHSAKLFATPRADGLPIRCIKKK